MPICLKLRAVRKANEVTQSDLADHLGISQAHLSRLERGKSRLSVDQVQAAAGYLGVSVSDLMSEPAAAV